MSHLKQRHILRRLLAPSKPRPVEGLKLKAEHKYEHAGRAQAKAVFAHFMADNVPSWNVNDWVGDIHLAQAAGIDAFALNIAAGNGNQFQQIANAFQAAAQVGFSLFFSFDYAGGGPWAEPDVISLLQQYKSNNAYFQYQGKPLASTFEGPGNAADWANIKAQTDCFFIPDWSSIGAQAAVERGTADGLFNWAAWPNGPENMTTDVDASYLHFLEDKPYMMAVSPWFYTNLPGYNKNWLWKGDSLWFDRWQQIFSLQPDLVEILTWNDYGESHYIGPLHEEQYGLFSSGAAPFNYAQNMSHDGWRETLPFLVNTYKNGSSTINNETLVTWYRLMPAAACNSGGTMGNTASQAQTEYEPKDVLSDSIFFSAFLASPADVSVSIGGTTQTASWSSQPNGTTGMYFGSVPFNGASGDVVVTVSRGGSTVAQVKGASIGGCADNGFANFNAWVGSSAGPALSGNASHCMDR